MCELVNLWDIHVHKHQTHSYMHTPRVHTPAYMQQTTTSQGLFGG